MHSSQPGSRCCGVSCPLANHGSLRIGSRRSNNGTTSFASVSCGSPKKVLPNSVTPRPASRPPRSKSRNDRSWRLFSKPLPQSWTATGSVADLIRHAGVMLDTEQCDRLCMTLSKRLRESAAPSIPASSVAGSNATKDARCAGFYLERRGTRQRASLWRIRRYEQRDAHEPRWPENNSQNSQNSLSMIGDEQFAGYRRPPPMTNPLRSLFEWRIEPIGEHFGTIVPKWWAETKR